MNARDYQPVRQSGIHPQAYVVTGPASEPITADELKLAVRIDNDAEDTLITSYIQTAREMYENYTSRLLISQSCKQVVDFAPCGREVMLLKGPIISIDAIKYRDDVDGTVRTFGSSNYTADTARLPARIWLNEDADWPDCGSYPSAFIIEFTAGYGSDATSVPARAKTAITLLAAHLYENRLPLNIGNIVNELPFSMRHLLEQDRLFLV